MFKKRITPFACTVVSLLVCAATVIATLSISSVGHKQEVNETRTESAALTKYLELLELVGDDQDKYAKLSTLFSLIEANYIHDYNEDEVWENIFTVLAMSLGDDYSYYLTSDEYDAVVDSVDGNFVGIGVHATYDIDTQGIYIFGVLPDSPAMQAGLQAGDIIVKVEDIESSDEAYYNALNAIRGEAGTDVKLTILRGEETIEFSVTRQSVKSETILYKKLENNVAYIRILTFEDQHVSDDFVKTIARAQSDSCDKFIFDLRNNGGGYREEVTKVLDLLLPEGPIVNVTYKNGEVKTYSSDANCIQGEMVVLCNGNTASAAELFTAALRDYELATIVGENTFGKGTLQTTKTLSDGSMIKLSVAYYNPPSNVNYDKVGIKPDYEISLSEYWQSRFFKMPIEDDAQLQKAIEILQNK